MNNRTVIASANGVSESVLVPNRLKDELWVLAITSPNWSGGMQVDLEASLDEDTWFPATNVAGAVQITDSQAVLASAGVYYRMNISNFSDIVTLTIKPRNAR